MIGNMSHEFEISENSPDKIEVFQQAANILLTRSFKLIDFDIQKPWGFYLSIDQEQASEFIKVFYDGARPDGIDTSLELRPKFLGIAPGKRLSWQYHHRRAEIWRTLAGNYSLVTSPDDQEQPSKKVEPGEVVVIPQGTRHRGIGLDGWALVAEIWQHTDPTNPSSEADIIRVQDDFGRG
jgi:mannose-6-phosphate isomerase-like protein (cupin superfamily)